jgi:hypothetical protein
MTTTQTTTDPPGYAYAGRLIDALARQDFSSLGHALDDDVHLRALVTPGLVELHGSEAVVDKFRYWFGDTDGFDLLDATIGEVAGRLHLSWRVRLRAPRLGEGWRVVEQQTYLTSGESGRIARLDLLCTGYMTVRKEIVP